MSLSFVAVGFNQLQYTEEYVFTSEDEDSEEEQHRQIIRKLLIKIVKVFPALSLQFLCEVVSEMMRHQPLALLPWPVRVLALFRYVMFLFLFYLLRAIPESRSCLTLSVSFRRRGPPLMRGWTFPGYADRAPWQRRYSAPCTCGRYALS